MMHRIQVMITFRFQRMHVISTLGQNSEPFFHNLYCINRKCLGRRLQLLQNIFIFFKQDGALYISIVQEKTEVVEIIVY